MTKWIIAIIALLGLAMGVWTVATSGRDSEEPPPASPPSINPFDAGIAATGLVEASSRNIAIAAPEAGLVTEVFVQVNDRVDAGEPLFQIDPLPLQSDLLEARAGLAAAQARLAQLEAAPRPEQVPILEAQLASARADAQLAQSQFEQVQQIYQQNAATQDELARRRYALEAAEARAAEAAARLAELRAGTWEQELNVTRAEVAQARARVEALEQRLSRLTVRAPIAGTVLKRRIEPGEYAAPATATVDTAPLVLGRIDPLHVRAQVDEEDAPRLRLGAEAVARVRGPRDVQLPLEMLRIEPLAGRKTQLSGLNTELIDTRVVDVVFVVEDTQGTPLYPGQIVDVFIEAE